MRLVGELHTEVWEMFDEDYICSRLSGRQDAVEASSSSDVTGWFVTNCRKRLSSCRISAKGRSSYFGLDVNVLILHVRKA